MEIRRSNHHRVKYAAEPCGPIPEDECHDDRRERWPPSSRKEKRGFQKQAPILQCTTISITMRQVMRPGRLALSLQMKLHSIKVGDVRCTQKFLRSIRRGESQDIHTGAPPG
jgi:hypothetical protein